MGRSVDNPKINFRATGTLKNVLDDATESSVSHPNMAYAPALADGVSAGQVNRAWQIESQSILKNEQTIVDIRDFDSFSIGAGVGLDGLGQDLLLEKVVFIAIVNENANSSEGVLEILPANSEGWTPIGTHTGGSGIGGKGVLIKCDPTGTAFNVTATNHRINLRAVGDDVTWSMYIWGRSDNEESSSSSSVSSSQSSSSSASNSSSQSSSSSSQSTSSSSQSTSLSSASSQSTSSSSQSTSSSSSSQSTSSSSSSNSSSSSSNSSSSMSSQSA